MFEEAVIVQYYEYSCVNERLSLRECGAFSHDTAIQGPFWGTFLLKAKFLSNTVERPIDWILRWVASFTALHCRSV
jgi:hypothetical protein